MQKKYPDLPKGWVGSFFVKGVYKWKFLCYNEKCQTNSIFFRKYIYPRDNCTLFSYTLYRVELCKTANSITVQRSIG